MPRSKSWILRTLSSWLLGLVLVGCSSRETRVEEGNRTGTLHLAVNAEPRDLDPQLIVAFTDMQVVLSLCEGLTAVDETTSQPIPGAAESWDVSDDGLHWTFRIRPGLKWSDGVALTSADFAFGLERALTPSLASEYAYILYAIKGSEAYHNGKSTDFSTVGIKAPDALTLELTLDRPAPVLPAILALPISFPTPRHVVEAHGGMADRGNTWTRPEFFVGNGPFRMMTWEPNQVITVVRNPNFRDAAQVELNAINFYPYENLSTQEAAFRAGQLHITGGVPNAKIPAYRRENPAALRSDPFLETWFFRCNTTRPPLDDVRVRQALALAIDREYLVKHVAGGGQLPAFSLVPPGSAGYVSPTGFLQTDQDKARALLAEAGYPGGKGFPKFDIIFYTNDLNQRMIEAVQQVWKQELGIEVSLALQEQRVWLNNQTQLNFDLAFARWVGDYVDPYTYLELFLSNSGNNNTGWGDPRYDQLVLAAGAENDPTKRNALYQQAERRFLEELAVAPVFFGTQNFLIQPNVQGWEPALLGFHRYQFVRLK